MTHEKKIGILGGMGPSATLHLFELIIRLTKAEKDQEHITTIIYNNPATPDRTDAIFNRGPSPVEELIKGAVNLEKAGADFILMPCVTAHHFLNQVEKEVEIEFVHLLRETLDYILGYPGNLKRIGLIATTGTIKTRLFQDMFEKSGLQIVVPGPHAQELFMEAIYGKNGVKNGNREESRLMLLDVLEQLKLQKVDAVIAGCTEIPLLLEQKDMAVPFINPLRILAEIAIQKAGYPFNENK